MINFMMMMILLMVHSFTNDSDGKDEIIMVSFKRLWMIADLKTNLKLFILNYEHKYCMYFF